MKITNSMIIPLAIQLVNYNVDSRQMDLLCMMRQRPKLRSFSCSFLSVAFTTDSAIK